jgi:hypothetical protein
MRILSDKMDFEIEDIGSDIFFERSGYPALY